MIGAISCITYCSISVFWHHIFLLAYSGRWQNYGSKGCEVIVLDIPLLFETKMDRWTNPVIVVWVNPETQIERLMSRDGCSEEQAQNRINAQLALDWKKSEVDIVIDNSGSLDDTKQQFQEVLRKVSEPLTWKERLRSRDGLISVVMCTVVGVLLAQKNLL